MTRLRIMSGGQTGVDRAALDAALALNLACGGWCPAGRRAEDSPISDKYPLIETESHDYAERTLANVRDSDGTLILINSDINSDSPGRLGAMSQGTLLTAEAARASDRPLFIARLDMSKPGGCSIEDITDWIGDHKISVLNIAGPRESECPGIYAATHALILKLLVAVGGQ